MYPKHFKKWIHVKAACKHGLQVPLGLDREIVTPIIIWLLHNLVEVNFDLFRYLLLKYGIAVRAAGCLCTKHLFDDEFGVPFHV